MKLAVTGATGFVGGHLLHAALAAGHEVNALARRPQPLRDGVSWVAGDLDDRAALGRLVEGADAVIHLAGATNAPDAAGFDRANRQGTANLVAALGSRPLVHVSSLAAREPGLSLYGGSKAAAEAETGRARGPWTILRPPAVYGPGDHDLLQLFRACLLPVVPVVRARAAMIYAPDLAQALLALAADLAGPGASAGGAFEVDDGAGAITQAALARRIAGVLGRRPRVVEVPRGLLRLGAEWDEARARMAGRRPRLSRDRARYLAHPDWSVDMGPLAALGLWSPSIGLDEGLARTAAAYRAAGLLPQLSPQSRPRKRPWNARPSSSA